MAVKDFILGLGPRAYWPLDDAAGSSVVADASGNGHDGSILQGVTLGETWPVGVGGACALFSNGDINCGQIDSQLFTGATSEFTVIAEIIPDVLNSGTTNHSVGNVFLSNASDNNNDNFEWGLRPSDGMLEVYYDSSSINGKITSSTTASVGERAFLVLAGNVSSSESILYKNSVADVIYTNFSTLTSVASPFHIGDSGNFSNPFSGKMRHVALFDRALTTNEIESLDKQLNSIQNFTSDNKFNLSWDAVTNAARYGLVVDGAAEIDLGNVTSYTDSAGGDGEVRTYELAAYDASEAVLAVGTTTSPMFNVPVLATGGEKSLIFEGETPYVVHTFIDDGTFEVLQPITFDCVFVGAGGSGARGDGSNYGSGGSGAELSHRQGVVQSPDTLSVTVGPEAVGPGGSGATDGNDGLPSAIRLSDNTLVAYAAGGIGGIYAAHAPGGSSTSNGLYTNHPGGRGGRGWWTAGGGGAGGYSGAGGNAGDTHNGRNVAGEAGTGGAAGAGSAPYGGGGTGVSGEGSSGAAQSNGGGFGGSGGGDGSASSGGAYGGGGPGVSTSGVPGSGGPGAVTIKYEVSLGWANDAEHAHTADQVTIWTPPSLAPHAPAHAHTAEAPTLIHQSVLRNLDSWHKHRALNNFHRFDFALQSQTHRQTTDGYLLELTTGHLGATTLPTETLSFGSTVVENNSLGIFAGALDSLVTPSHFAGFTKPFQFLQLSKFSTAEYPIAFDFVAVSDDLLFIHANNFQSASDQIKLTVLSPLGVHTASRSQTTSQFSVRNWTLANADDIYHNTSSSQVRLRHNIPFQHIDGSAHAASADNAIVVHRSPARAASPTHAHAAAQLDLTHTSPLGTVESLHGLTDDLAAVTNRSIARSNDSAHGHIASTPGLTHTSPLAILVAQHYHRAKRLNFLPDDWVFRALITVPRHERAAAVGQHDRSSVVALLDRAQIVEAQDRSASVPAQLREAAVLKHDRTASIASSGDTLKIGD